MGNEPVIMVIGTDCPPEVAEDWGKWYSETHVPDVFKFKGVIKASRYKIRFTEREIERSAGESVPEYPEYLAIYEFENWQALEDFYGSPEREAAAKDWSENWAPKGTKIKWRVFYEPVGSWQP